ncbi:benzoate/H(+) symporter BenE family transporter [Deinococcus sp. Leaf326]|uniref:benzoate/H(+) symporter BenE family transporter n=1 Tax=Deinococcus sp. Leaf326 TaxID=1736338 RepID=UPI0006F306A7|nr:benzoate/H(+) symporter BenE family transporter [Deinococcus sp. Leaf326]KQR04426.1 hypothetical protein ASF71_10215 [Deinococcus sp. Leaf326]
MSDLRRVPVGALVAGMVAVLVSFASNIPLFVQAFAAAHYSPAQGASGLASMYLLLGVMGMVLCWRYRVPVILGWNTPGLAVLIAEAGQFSTQEVVGALLVSGAVLFLIGLSRAFDWLARALPLPLASALLAGVLLPFVLRGLAAIPQAPALTVPTLLAFVLVRVFAPRWAVPSALVVGVSAAALTGTLHFGGAGTLHLLARPEWITPVFSAQALLTLALPCTVLALTSQHLAGMAVLRSHGYQQPPPALLVTVTGAASVVAAPVGSVTLNMGAITAAMCMGPDVHPDPGRRYVAGLVCAAGYLVLALCAGALLGLAGTFPAPLLYLLAGLALLGPVLGGVQHALAEPRWREGALLTLACTAAGFSLLGIGGAVWGLGLGWGSAALGEWVRRRRERPDAGRSDAS